MDTTIAEPTVSAPVFYEFGRALRTRIESATSGAFLVVSTRYDSELTSPYASHLERYKLEDGIVKTPRPSRYNRSKPAPVAPLEEPGSIYSILFLQKTHARFLERVLEKIEASLAWAEDGFLESEPKPITHHRDDPRWQAAHSEYQALDKRELGKSMDLICLMRDIEKIYENLDARIEAASKILKKSPSSAQIPADERRAIACAMARELV